MNADDAEGALSIWNDIRPGREADFDFWFKSEHFAERLSVLGFRLGRRFEALTGEPRYFVYYLTDTPEVLTSPAYLERLNNPTPLTRIMMTEGFLNMTRALCRRAERYGTLSGAICVTVRFDTLPDREMLAAKLRPLADADGVARCELWSSIDRDAPVAEEEKLRGGDRGIAGCAVVQTLREADAGRVAAGLSRDFGASAEIGIYRLLSEIGSSVR
jgi:hypothetical protein